MELDKIRTFYDNFVAEQVRSGANPRIRGLFRRMIALGLKKDARVLELGCGVGMLTKMVADHVSNGVVEAVDLSEASIRYARDHFSGPNTRFVVDDVVSYRPEIDSPDMITLFDILEHVPMERHDALFENISSLTVDHTRILINIPSPASIVYDREHNPSALQVIDQALPLSFILGNIEKHGLELKHFETYSIWVENDYQFMEVVRRIPYTGQLLPESLIQKIRRRF